MANLKGGVGKTTCALMLAEGLSSLHNPSGAKNRVLVVDADPQAHISYSFIGEDALASLVGKRKTLNALMVNRLLYDEETDIEDFVVKNVSRVLSADGKNKPTKSKIDLLPCTPELIFTERQVLAHMTRAGVEYKNVQDQVDAFVSQYVLGAASGTYDWIVVDSAPGLNLLTYSAIATCDSTVIVTVPEPLPIFGMNVFLNADRSGRSRLPSPRRPLLLMNRFRERESSHKSLLHSVQTRNKGAKYEVLKTIIPEVAAFSSESFFEVVLRSFKSKYTAKHAEVPIALATEITEKVNV